MASWYFRIALVVTMFCLPVLAHDGLHEQLREATKQILLDPGNAELYLKRAELYRLHRDWTEALADYAKARKLAPSLLEVEFCRGRMWLEAGDHQSAQAALDRFLALRPEHGEAWLCRARVKSKLQQPQQAAAAYQRAFALLPRLTPDHYIERLQAQLAAAQVEEALRGLEEGIARLGPLVTLQLPAMELELKQQRWDAALTRLAQVATQSPRQESWLWRRGEILRQAGRAAEARAAFLAAQQALEQLPPSQRQTKAMQELAHRIQAALAQ
jgi:tetratricopeptide (TPR) repeat protein